MYRSQDNNLIKINNDIVDDENYEFTGATLKISSNQTISENTLSSINNNNNNSNNNNNNDDENINNTMTQNTYVTAGGTTVATSDYLRSGDANAQRMSDDNLNSETSQQKIGSPAHFFSFRSGQFEKAVDDIINILLRPSNDVNILGKWLLTEISHWDHERERVFILTTKTLLVVKYDFIALRVLQHNKIRLTQVDTLIRGKLTYPETSLVPRIEGITNGVASIVQGNLFVQQQTNSEISSNETRKPTIPSVANNLAIANRFDFTHFKPVERNDIGIRIMWNRGQPISFLTSWNPFATDIPWITFKDHPLYAYQDRYNSPSIQENLDKNRKMYSADNLYDQLFQIFSNNDDNSSEVNYSCLFQNEPIIMQNYVGIGAVIHNKNNFGFFKVRGKFSF